MNNVIANYYFRSGRGPERYPTREQNLFVSLSKHLYVVKDESLRSQSKELDPRTAGTKQLLRRYVLLDVDTGVLYGEYHLADDEIDVVGFLARAWHKKAQHPMRGFPQALNIPKSLDDAVANEIMELCGGYAVEVGFLEGGFGAGIHAIKQFERQVESLISWRGSQPQLWAIQRLSALISVQASNSMSHTWTKEWEKVAEIPDEFFRFVDTLYTEHGAWRDEPFDVVLNGLSKD
ncbi:hypothetical protein [Burkholderia ambifaria]|uniref:hypothetical protein n=1 Tax=Burkholderia ambifaria TaxID=152480 RepID=UPI002FDFB834